MKKGFLRPILVLAILLASTTLIFSCSKKIDKEKTQDPALNLDKGQHINISGNYENSIIDESDTSLESGPIKDIISQPPKDESEISHGLTQTSSMLTPRTIAPTASTYQSQQKPKIPQDIKQANEKDIKHPNKEDTSKKPIFFIVRFIDYDGNLIESARVGNGESAPAPNPLPREGYTFTGWDKDFANITSHLTVKSQYKVNQYGVIFDTNGGSSIQNINVEYDKQVSKPRDPTKANYRFAGWYSDKALTRPFDFNKELMPAQDLRLYAKWNEIKLTSISISGKGGVANVSKGEPLPLIASISPSNATNKNVSWSIEKGSSRASITKDGIFTGKDFGSVIIRATAQDGSGVVGKTKIMVGPFEFDDATGTIIAYNKDGESDIVIPSRISGVEVIAIGEKAFAGKDLNSVVIPDSVKYIERNAFSENALKSVTIPERVENVASGAFCSNQLNYIIIGEGVEIGDDMLCNENNNFRTAYQGTGIYYGTQEGGWSEVSIKEIEVKGEAEFGNTLRVTGLIGSAMDPIPPNTLLTYQWLRNGDPIEGATSPTYLLTNADIGRCISIEVIYKKEDKSSEETALVTRGDGSKDSPYAVATANQLNGFVRDHPYKHYVQIEDIDLSEYNNWTPIPKSSGEFNGVFDGSGYTINNLSINQTAEDNVGLFSKLAEEGVLQNIHLKNVDIGGRYYTGSLVGYSFGDVIHCSSQGSVKGASAIGGLLGSNLNGSITNSYATCDVTGDIISSSHVGGLVGYSQGGTIKNSYATGKVKGNKDVGGLVGCDSGNSKISNSYATGKVKGKDNVGGLVGISRYPSITNSYYNSQTSGQSDTGKGEPRTTYQMQEGYSNSKIDGEPIYTDWQEVIWNFSIKNSYPILKRTME